MMTDPTRCRVYQILERSVGIDSVYCIQQTDTTANSEAKWKFHGRYHRSTKSSSYILWSKSRAL